MFFLKPPSRSGGLLRGTAVLDAEQEMTDKVGFIEILRIEARGLHLLLSCGQGVEACYGAT